MTKAISNAHRLLTQRACSLALGELNSVGYQNRNADYLSAYASAQACSSDFDEPSFFADSVDSIGSTNSNFLGSLSVMETSETQSSLDTNYLSLKNAINTLLYAGGIGEPSHENRVESIGATAANNLGIQTFYMLLFQMGKYFYLHGNTNANGQKGARESTGNPCLTDYTTVRSRNARATLSSNPSGSLISPCAGDSDGHSELSSTSPERKQLLCEGIILFNNTLDIISHIAISEENTGSLSRLRQELNDNCADANLGSICDQKSQSNCEDNESIENIELFFLAVFETMLTDS